MPAVTPPGSTDRERYQALPAEVALWALVFQNMFNAFSPFITLAVNAAFALTLLIHNRCRHSAQALTVLAVAYAVFVWLLLVSVFRGDAELQVLLKYGRVAVTVTLFAVIFGSSKIRASSMVTAINLALGFHVLLVILQIAFPDLTYATAPIFGFEREPEILEQYTLRKLGASSSYDTASLLSLAALLFFYLQFAQGRGPRYLLAAAIAFAASLMSSRTGVALALLVVAVLLLHALLRAGALGKAIASLGIVGLLVFAFLFVYPLLLHSLGLSELDSYESGVFFASTDYGTTGTLEALTEGHLLPLQAPLFDLFVGYAIDPNTIDRYTDIGYVKLIYHVGILGASAIVFGYLYMFVMTRRFMRALGHDSDLALIGRFLVLFIPIAILFNYKSLELHSRGTGDFIYLLFLFLASWHGFRMGSSRPSPFAAKRT